MAAPRKPQPMKQSEFRQGVIDKYLQHFDLHWRIRKIFESAVKHDRYLHELVPRALDMLFVQSFGAHVSTYELACLAQVEDAATIVRRLLELAAQAHYIGLHPERRSASGVPGPSLHLCGSSGQTRLTAPSPQTSAKPGTMFRPLTARTSSPTSDTGARISGRFSRSWKGCTNRRGRLVGAWNDDYRYLSNVAHGSPPALVHSYGQPIVPLHDDRQVPAILLAGASYALLCAMVWNEVVRCIPDAELFAIADDIGKLSPRRAGPEKT